MKFMFLAGGCTGFVLAGATGLFADRAYDLALRDAALGCLVGALLFRWFWSVIVKAMTETLTARRAAAREIQEAVPAPVRSK